MKYLTIIIILSIQFALSFSQVAEHYLKFGGNYQFESTSFMGTDYKMEISYPGAIIALGYKSIEGFFSLNGTIYHRNASNNNYSLNYNFGINYFLFNNFFITGLLNVKKELFSSKTVNYYFGIGVGYDVYIKERIGFRGVIYGYGLANNNVTTSMISELIFFYKLNLNNQEIN